MDHHFFALSLGIAGLILITGLGHSHTLPPAACALMQTAQTVP